jgi:hypothetical protein
MDNLDAAKYFDVGDRDDVDRSLIRRIVAMTPEQPLDHHEDWRLFLKGAQQRAVIHQRSSGQAKNLAVLPVLQATLQTQQNQ